MTVGALLLGALPAVSAVGASSSAPTVYWEGAQKGIDPVNFSQFGGQGIAVAEDGAVILTGSFADTVYFPKSAATDDSIPLTSSGGSDVFVAGFDTNTGFFTWAQRAGGSASAEATSVAVLGDDSVFLTGDFYNTAAFPSGPGSSISVSAPGNGRALFVAELNRRTGYFRWAQLAGDNGPSRNVDGLGVAVTDEGTVLVTGRYQGAPVFRTGPSSSITLTDVGGGFQQAFVAKMNADDSYFSWVQRVSVATPGSMLSGGNSVAAPDDSTVFVTGRFSGTASFPTGPGTSATFTATGGDDIFVGSMSTDDSYFDWVQRAGGTGSDIGESVAVGDDSTVFVTGNFQGTATFPTGPSTSTTLTSRGSDDVFIAAMNSDDSYFAWAQRLGGTNYEEGRSVAVSATGAAVVTGYFYSTMYFPTADDSIALTANGNNGDIFVAALNADDSYFAWAQRAGGTGNDYAWAGAVAADGTVSVTGSFSGTATFPAGPSTSSSLSTPGTSLFTGWLLPSVTPTPPVPPTPPVTYPPGAPTDVAASAGDRSASVSWSAPPSSGSFPITHYQVSSAPSGKICLASAPALTCEVPDLTNGVDYAFQVRALNGAGWGAWSEASAVVTPEAPVTVSILIAGSRGEVRGKAGVRVLGKSTGLGVGAVVRPWVKLAGETAYAEGVASSLVDAAGKFEWQRRTGKKVYVYMSTPDRSSRSNRVIIPAR